MEILSAILFGIVVTSTYSNYQNWKQFIHYRNRANERLIRLERAAEKNGIKLPRLSFGFLMDEDVYPNSDLDDENYYSQKS